MACLIKNGAVVDDAWTTSPWPRAKPGIRGPARRPRALPLPVWRARKDEILARGEPAGLFLQDDDRVEDVAADLAHFAVVPVNFPEVRQWPRLFHRQPPAPAPPYRGEVRAVGDVLHDQLFFMARVGFDAFALHADKNPAYAWKKASPRSANATRPPPTSPCPSPPPRRLTRPPYAMTSQPSR